MEANRGQILTALQTRSAVKVFDATKKITIEDWEVIEQSLVLSPSSFGLQPWKFIIITDQKLKERLAAASFYNEAQVVGCSHLVVFCSKTHISPEYVKKHIEKISKISGKTPEMLEAFYSNIVEYLEKLGDHKEYCSNQTFISLGMAMSTASMLGLASCPIGGFEAAKFTEILGIEEGLVPSVLCAFGYKDTSSERNKMPKVRFDYKDLIIKY